MECIVETANYYDHNLSIFDCYVGCTGLKSCAVCTFCLTGRHTLVNLKHVRMHWLNRAACLVAEVKCAFVGPLRRTFDTAIKSESLAFWIY